MSSVKVGQVMTDVPVTIHPDDSFREAVRRLMFHDVSGLPVVDDESLLVGIVTEADLMAKEAQDLIPRGTRTGLIERIRRAARSGGRVRAGRQTRVADVMTTDVVTTTTDERLHRAARRMAHGGFRRMPVVDADGRVVGILSRHDVLEVFDRSDAELEAAVRDSLNRSLYMRPEAEVELDVSLGVVTLRGTVRYESDVRIAGSIVSSVDGVIDVVNELTFKHADPQMHRAG